MSADTREPRSFRATSLRAPANGDVYLHPGEFAASAEPCTITTILGSCVGVCLFDPAARIGGLNHFLLPLAPAHEKSPRFGDVALARLIESVECLGAQRHRLVAKVIGGACVLDAYRGGAGHIGRQNVRSALQSLMEHQIVVTTIEVGGDRARKLRFRPDTGDLVVHTI
ncbi:MAG TPA: chemotaxis protein CheD [Gemmatimonadaceae bacterium]|nr:chemotaxis protein CheD [Gemmatimonadaceae bacterium]